MEMGATPILGKPTSDLFVYFDGMRKCFNEMYINSICNSGLVFSYDDLKTMVRSKHGEYVLDLICRLVDRLPERDIREIYKLIE